jgi:hypothetical protein
MDSIYPKGSIWGDHEVSQEQLLKLKIGPLIIWAFREKQELRIAWEQISDDANSIGTELPEPDSWQRWAFKQKNPRIEIKPVFPDRPVLVKPENPFRVAEDASVRVYVRIPVWVRINLLGKPKTKLIDIPVVTLSNTWFGGFQEGDLCYWLSSGARLTIEPDPNRPYMVICPLQLIDRSPIDLNVEKICLRVQNLSLFIDKEQLWADETKITYRGKSEISEVQVSGNAPKEAKTARLINEPQITQKKSFSAKTFSTIKELPGFGFLTKD